MGTCMICRMLTKELRRISHMVLHRQQELERLTRLVRSSYKCASNSHGRAEPQNPGNPWNWVFGPELNDEPFVPVHLFECIWTGALGGFPFSWRPCKLIPTQRDDTSCIMSLLAYGICTSVNLELFPQAVQVCTPLVIFNGVIAPQKLHVWTLNPSLHSMNLSFKNVWAP